MKATTYYAETLRSKYVTCADSVWAGAMSTLMDRKGDFISAKKDIVSLGNDQKEQYGLEAGAILAPGNLHDKDLRDFDFAVLQSENMPNRFRPTPEALHQDTLREGAGFTLHPLSLKSVYPSAHKGLHGLL